MHAVRGLLGFIDLPSLLARSFRYRPASRRPPPPAADAFLDLLVAGANGDV